VTDVLILTGLTGWYVTQHERIRFQVLLGFVLGVVGVALIRSNGSFPGIDT
jgi:drug/metabolite transporter (DMT)-like permease